MRISAILLSFLLVSNQANAFERYAMHYFLTEKKAPKKYSDLQRADLRSQDFSGCHAEYAFFNEGKFQMTSFANAKLRGINAEHANFAGADLSGADLRDVDFGLANLRAANLTGANLDGANLSQVTADGANFMGASLNNTKLIRADLRAANLTNVNLEKADIQGANLRGANLTGAKLPLKLPKDTLVDPDPTRRVVPQHEYAVQNRHKYKH
jgi:uncharacterized protein YjbI with pentapeptide repeats